jgi:hypothetical protein
VRTENGREVAVIAVSAGLIKEHQRGFNVEMSLEGTWQIDIATGVELKIDLVGKCGISPLTPKKGKRGRAPVPPSNVRVIGEGSLEMHRTARLLGPEGAPQPGDSTATAQ